MLIFLINLLLCIFGTFLSSMSGCGTGIIILPIWIMMGYSLPLGLAVLQLTSVLWCPFAAKNYLKGEKFDFKLLVALIVFGLLGTFIGANTIAKLDQTTANRFVGAIVILVATLINFVDQKSIAKSKKNSNDQVVALLAFPLGIYEAAFGAGNAIITSFALMKARGLELSQALGYYYAAATFWCLSSGLIYFYSGFSDWSLLAAATIGSIIGAELGSKFGRAKGSKFLEKSVLIAGVLLGIKLIVSSLLK